MIARGWLRVAVLAGGLSAPGCTKSPPAAQPASKEAAVEAAATPAMPPAEAGAAGREGERITDLFGNGVIRGVVRLRGPRPEPRRLSMRGDRACEATGGSVPSPATMLGASGGVPHVFVYVKRGIAGPYTTPVREVTLDQRGCLFEPHVFGLQAGQPLRILNSDDTLHNVHALTRRNEAFNLRQGERGAETVVTFARPEVMIKFKCDVHGWMDAYCGVLGHPFFAVTGPDGAFEIARLPAGEYVLEARHELWGTLRERAVLEERGTRRVDFTYAHRPAAGRAGG